MASKQVESTEQGELLPFVPNHYSSHPYPSLKLQVGDGVEIEFVNGLYVPETQEDQDKIEEFIRDARKRKVNIDSMVRVLDVSAAEKQAREHLANRGPAAIAGAFTTDNLMGRNSEVIASKIETDAQHAGGQIDKAALLKTLRGK